MHAAVAITLARMPGDCRAGEPRTHLRGGEVRRSDPRVGHKARASVLKGHPNHPRLEAMLISEPALSVFSEQPR
jgi:hypothetical protein